MDPICSITNELSNTTIKFIDNCGNIVFTYEEKDNNICCFGEITKFNKMKLKKIKKNKKYHKLSDISNNYYIGDFEDEVYYNMMAQAFLLKKSKPFSKIIKYMIYIIDNPYYNEDSHEQKYRGKYNLLIFEIKKVGVYFHKLEYYDSYTSTI